MALHRRFSTRVITLVCTFVLSLPLAAQAASGQDLTAMRSQLQALSARLDRLETENRKLTKANAELAKANQQATVAIAQVSDQTRAVAAKVQKRAEVTDWTNTIRWKGDFRYRYESFNIEGKPDRNRNRIRARAQMLAKVTPTIEVGLGLASGGNDPVSTNQTLGKGGSTKGLNLDMAYFDWSGLANTHVVGGKFKNFIHKSGKNGLLWDGDWRPEGGGIAWNNGKFFANGLGTWIESDSKKDQSFAFLTQVGVKIPLGDALKLTAGVGYHQFDTKGSGSFFGADNDFFGNSFNPVTHTYLNDYQDVELFADLGFSLLDHPAQIFGNYVENTAADNNDTAYAFGIKYGKAKNQGQWAFAYVYQKIEADSVFGLLTDSDFGGGGTDSKGHIFKGSYAIAKNFNAKFAYFINDAGLKSGSPIDYRRLQLDLSFKY